MKKSLLLLVPDKNTQFALNGALGRPEALGIDKITFEVLVHSGRDGGVRTSGAALAALKRKQFSHLLMVFDHEGCGAEDRSVNDLIVDIEDSLKPVWQNEACVVVIEPEVDIWMWGNDNVLAELLTWKESLSIREWLKAAGFTFNALDKPERPKECMEAILKHLKEPRSSSLYAKIASKISLNRCSDPAFKRLKDALQRWFPL